MFSVVFVCISVSRIQQKYFLSYDEIVIKGGSWPDSILMTKCQRSSLLKGQKAHLHKELNQRGPAGVIL